MDRRMKHLVIVNGIYDGNDPLLPKPGQKLDKTAVIKIGFRLAKTLFHF